MEYDIASKRLVEIGKHTFLLKRKEVLNVRFHNVPERLSEAVRKIEEHDKLKFLHRQAIVCESLNNFEERLTRSMDFKNQ